MSVHGVQRAAGGPLRFQGSPTHYGPGIHEKSDVCLAASPKETLRVSAQNVVLMCCHATDVRLEWAEQQDFNF